MAKIHDKYVIELAEVIKGYGNDPDVEDPFELSLFYRFCELPNIAIQRENFLKMKPLEPRKGKWMRYGEDGNPNEEDTVFWQCDQCLETYTGRTTRIPNYCPNCGVYMKGGEDE